MAGDGEEMERGREQVTNRTQGSVPRQKGITSDQRQEGEPLQKREKLSMEIKREIDRERLKGSGCCREKSRETMRMDGGISDYQIGTYITSYLSLWECGKSQ